MATYVSDNSAGITLAERVRQFRPSWTDVPVRLAFLAVFHTENEIPIATTVFLSDFNRSFSDRWTINGSQSSRLWLQFARENDEIETVHLEIDRNSLQRL